MAIQPSLAIRFQKSQPLEKKSLLEVRGARFILTGEKVTIELQKPFAFLLERKTLKKTSELRVRRFSTGKSTDFPPKIRQWCDFLNEIRTYFKNNSFYCPIPLNS